MAKGIDIYKYQTVNNWQRVKDSGVTFVYVKHTDGGGPAPTRADGQVKGAKSVGLPVGGYHYAQLSPSPETQADVLINEIERLGSKDLVPMLDLEAPFGANSIAKDFGIRFCRRVQARGYRPGVYMNNSFAKAIRPDTWDTNPVLWIARYGAKPDLSRYDIHQYADNGAVSGIAGSVDMNESYTNAHFVSVVTPGKEDDSMGINAYSYEPKLNEDGSAQVQRFVFIIPTVVGYHTVASQAWLSVKSGWGPIERVHVYGIKSKEQYDGKVAGYPIDQTWTNVPPDSTRVNVASVDGMDQFSVEVVSDVPFGITLEWK